MGEVTAIESMRYKSGREPSLGTDGGHQEKGGRMAVG